MLRALFMLVLIAASALGDAIEIDPRIVFDDLTARYRGAAVAERIEVRVLSEGQTRAETALFQFDPPAAVQLTLGALTVWTDSKVLRITDRADEQAYVERVVERGDVEAVLNSLLPPLPLPQVALALNDDPERALTPYCVGVRWSAAKVTDGAGGGVVSLSGTSARAEVTLTAEAAARRINRMSIALDGGRSTIEIITTPLEAREAPPMGIDTSRRVAVDDLAELRPRARRVVVGDEMPALGLTMWRDNRQVVEEPGGPCAVMLVRRWKPGGSPFAAYEAARQLTSEFAEFSPFVGLIMEPGEPNESAIMDGCEQEADPIEVRRGFSPDQTIARFDPESDLVLIVLDSADVVRVIEPLHAGAVGVAPDPNEVKRLTGLMRAGLARQ